MLATTGLMRDGGEPTYSFVTTGHPGEFETIGRRFLGAEMAARSPGTRSSPAGSPRRGR